MRASSLKWNVAASMMGNVWSAGLTIVTVPVFVHILGTEAYGLLGLFASLQVVFGLLDLGLALTVSRETAANLALGRSRNENAALLRTFEVIYWTIGTIIAVVAVFLARLIAEEWVNVQELTRPQVESALRIMAICFAVRWPVSLYRGVLQGHQQFVKSNFLLAGAASARTVGTIAVLFWVSPTIGAFLACQLIGNALEIGLFMIAAWKEQRGEPGAARFDMAVLRRTWRFALSFNVLSTSLALLAQVDRLVISKAFQLSELGLYSIAVVASGAVPLVASSVGAALFPRFSGLTAGKNRVQLAEDYHRAVQAVTFVGVAACFALALFPTEILLVWMQGVPPARLANSLAFLSVAGLFAAVSNPAYNLLLAAGRTRVLLTVVAIQFVLFVPLTIVIVPITGIVSAAMLLAGQSLIVSVVYPRAAGIVTQEPDMKRFLQDVMPYVLIAAAWLGVGRVLTLGDVGRPSAYVALVVGELGYLVTTLAFARAFDLFPAQLIFGNSGKRQSPASLGAAVVAAERQA